MAIFDIFRPQPQGQPQQQGQQPQQPTSGNPHVDANPMVPSANNTPQQQPTPQDPEPKSPNAEFAELWKIEPTASNQTPNFKIDPAQLNKVSSQMNFAKNVRQEDVAKIMQGGEEAVGALMNVLNAVGRDVFAMNAQFTSNMAESGYQAAQSSINSGLPNLVKQQFTRNELFESNPKLREPAMQPLVLAIQSQISQKYPNATAAEVNSMVDKYFNEVVAKSFAPEPQRDTQQALQDEAFNFASFLN